MTTTDKQSTADQIRAALKAAGFNARKVSVKHEHYSMGSTVHVTIRDASVPRSAVEAICSSFEKISRDHATGEILCGGNRFVEIDYADKVIAELAEPVATELQRLASEQPNIAATVEGMRIVVMRPDAACWHWTVSGLEELPNGRRLRVFAGAGTEAPEACHFNHAARQLVEARIERDAAISAAA